MHYSSGTIFGQHTWHSPWSSNCSEPLIMWAHSSQQNSLKNILRQTSDFHFHVLITSAGIRSGRKSESSSVTQYTDLFDLNNITPLHTYIA